MTAAIAVPAAAEQGPQAPPLDLHEGISTPTASGCLRFPARMRLMWHDADGFGFVRGRCKATNLCAYCRVLAVVETAEMLILDAMEYAPSLLLTLTAREHLTRSDTYRHLEKIRRSVRRVWPAAEWFVQVEFQKRGALHLHLLVKGVPVGDAQALLDRAGRVWCSRVDAEMPGQDCKAINAADAVVRYLQKELAHGLKREQAPPIGWKGHRTSQSRGYLVRPASVMREEARSSLRKKRALHAAARFVDEYGDPPDAQDCEDLARLLLEEQADRGWTLVAEHRGDYVAVAPGGVQPLPKLYATALRAEISGATSAPRSGVPDRASP